MKRQLLTILVFPFLIGLFSCKEDKSASSRKFIDAANFDSTVKPGDNFFLFVNGKWLKSAVIPPTETNIGSFQDLYTQTKANLRSILDAVSKTGQVPGSIEQKVGDLYASGMDSAFIESQGYEPLKTYIRQIENLTDAKSIMNLEADRFKENHSYVASMIIGPDQKNSSLNIANFQQTGLGLPDRDYYFKTDPATKAIQNAYLIYMRKIFFLTGDDSLKAAEKAAAVYELEKQMAESHRNNIELRDPQSNYNKLAVSYLDRKMPSIGWSAFTRNLGIQTDSLNISQPAYYSKLDGLLKSVSIDVWKAYYKFHIMDDAAPYLSRAFVNARFDYSGKALSGQQKIKPRWERIYVVVDNNLGDALGQLYVKKYFTEEAKNRMLEMVNNLQIAFANRIDKLDWMGDSTKQISKDKLHAFLKKIGYPDKWKDYGKVTIDKRSYFENLVSCSKNEYQYQISKMGKPVDKNEWNLTAPTINAFYNPTLNDIVFPAGILQFPFFDLSADDAVNYGGIGMVIGHEMTHGFDDQGAQFDKDGNLKNWWARQDSVQFVNKSKKVIKLYDGFTILDTVHVKGALTTGENMADIGGLAIAYDAFKMTKQGRDSARTDGWTPDQRFFLSFGQIWRDKNKEELDRLFVNTDPHSPAMYRVEGPLMNFTPFYTAFDVKPGDKMYVPDSSRIKIW
jgi:putative endopeptidase